MGRYRFIKMQNVPQDDSKYSKEGNDITTVSVGVSHHWCSDHVVVYLKHISSSLSGLPCQKYL